MIMLVTLEMLPMSSLKYLLLVSQRQQQNAAKMDQLDCWLKWSQTVVSSPGATTLSACQSPDPKISTRTCNLNLI